VAVRSANAEFVCRIFDTFPTAQERLREGTMPIGPPLAEAIEWDASEIALPDLGDGVLHGYEGVRRFWMAWLSAWDDVSFDYEVREAGENVVMLITQKNDTGKIALPLEYAQVWTFEDGQVVHWKVYKDRADALEAAGLDPGGDGA
jgi:hypothetical protein